MELNINKENKIIEVGDLVREKLLDEDEVVGIVVEVYPSMYNVVVFDNHYLTEDEKVYLNHLQPMNYQQLKERYLLVSKYKDVKINIEY